METFGSCYGELRVKKYPKTMSNFHKKTPSSLRTHKNKYLGFQSWNDNFWPSSCTKQKHI